VISEGSRDTEDWSNDENSALITHSKKRWVISSQIWVKYGWTTPNVGLKMQLKNGHLKVEFLNGIFNPTFGFVHILPNFGLKQPSIV